MIQVARPSIKPEDEQWRTLEQYLKDHWDRAVQARASQVDEDYKRWTKNYSAIPKEEIRTFPWYRASNVVVPLIRIFTDTFVARTLNIIFSTRPLCVAEGYPRSVRDGLELYVNHKVLYEWQGYNMARELMTRGNKTGTAVVKVPWVEDSSVCVIGGREEEVMEYNGPRPSLIPFEDFYIYPITANYLHQAVIKFNRLRFVEEEVKRKVQDGYWKLTDEDIEKALKTPSDIKRSEEQADAHIVDPYLREFHAVECHLRYRLGGRTFRLVCVLCPELNKLIDVYHLPSPRNEEIFFDYRPFPREDLFWGESMCQILEQMQEESTAIHNDRRNNSYIANAPIFKRRSGSLLPNPSSVWYPGYIFDLESMEDLEISDFGRNYDSMIDQEMHVIQLAERLSGIGALMQGYASGMMGKRGVYNTQGTMAIMQESNQRQDTNIRDVREVISSIVRCSFLQQKAFLPDDPTIDAMPPDVQDQVRTALKQLDPKVVHSHFFEIKASDAAVNAETRKQNAMFIMQTLAQYGSATLQMVTQLANPGLNPGVRLIMEQIMEMHKEMAKVALRAYGEYDLEVIPDGAQAVQAALTGSTGGVMGPGGPAGPAGMESAGGVGAEAMGIDASFLQALAQVPVPAGTNGGYGDLEEGA